jgi:hypothetical protein
MTGRPREFLVTVRNSDGKFIDQRRIEAYGQYEATEATEDAINWIKSKGGDVGHSTVVEVTKIK